MKAPITSAVALIMACFLLKEVEAIRKKMSLNSLDKANMTKVSSKLYPNPCKDKRMNIPEGMMQVTPDEEVEGRLREIKDVKFYRSPYVTGRINKLVEMTIEGTNHKAKEFFEIFKGKELFIFGGAVRDILLGKNKISDIDAETSYKLENVLEDCKKQFGEKLCHYKGVGDIYLINFGNEAKPNDMIDLASNEYTFYRDKKLFLEYTTNSIAYVYSSDHKKNEGLIVDLTGTSVADTCANFIRIPAVESNWDYWTIENPSGKKIFRYWKLKAKDFVPATKKHEEYAIEQAIKFIKEDDHWLAMTKYYCQSVFDGQLQKDCSICLATKEKCQDQKVQERHDKFSKLINQDIGWKTPECTTI